MEVNLEGALEKKKSIFIPRKNIEKIEKDKEANIVIEEEDISIGMDKRDDYNYINEFNKTYHSLKKNLSYNNCQNEDNQINKNNNFISIDDKNHSRQNKKNILCEKDFTRMRHQSCENKKNNEIMTNQLKEEYLEYIMLKEPKYADFEKISEDHRKKIYISFQKYNNNLFIIKNKKEEYKKILSEIEKSLVNNYYLKDSSMLPVYEQLIEQVKLNILTKQQEYDGYYKIYEELYNQNYTIKRKVLDEIDIDRINENFYDQYKILENHAVVQVSKKQDSLNQIEEYQKKILEEHDKELKQKNKILKDLKLQIEVFKEDEKDLVNKLKKLKAKREQINQIIKEKEKRRKNIQNNYIYNLKRYQKSYISMNKIFKSVNAKNLDDVLLDVNNLKFKFNKLKNDTIIKNLNISDLNNEYSKLNKKLNDIRNEIILTKNKKNTVFNQNDQERLMEIKNEINKINENEYRIKELMQNSKGTFQQGITFIFQKIKLLVANIIFLKKAISPKLVELINKYKNTPFSVDYEKIDKSFLFDFSFLFFQFGNIIFYLSLHSLSSIININYLNRGNIIIPINNKYLLDIYHDGVKKSLKLYNRRTLLKHEKQKEINKKTKKKEIEQKDDDKFMLENKAITQNQMFKRFIDYLRTKDNNSSREKIDSNQKENREFKDSFFFTGIDSIKVAHSKPLDISNRSSSIQNSNKYNKIKNQNINNKEMFISLRQKEDFLQKNKNKVMNIFSKYQNSLVKENDKNLYFQKKYMKKLPHVLSQEKPFRKQNYIKNKYIIENKRKNLKENFPIKKNKPMLLDDDYDYDEDEDEEDNKRKLSFKKNKTFSNFSFFKLNKDRANIYKKMNDLRKLQMSYFGGRFLNTKIRNGENSSYGNNIFDEFVSNYYRRQNQDNNYNNKNKKNLNFGKKLVNQISANKKLRSQSTFIFKKRIKYNNNDYISVKEKERLRKMNERKKSSFVKINKKTIMSSSKNDKSINKYKKMDNKNKTYTKSSINKKAITFGKNNNKDKTKNKIEISNYLSKK